MQIERTPLPGIGISYILNIAAGHRIGVVSRHDGRRDLVIYRREDPDSVWFAVSLSDAEAHHLADLLSSTTVVNYLAEDTPRHHDEVVAARLVIGAGSPYAGRTLRELPKHACHDVTVIAVIRGQKVISDPDAGFVLEHDDAVIAAGHSDRLADLGRVLNGDLA